MIFAVIREQGPSWNPSLAMRDQGYWPEHVTYINEAADTGLLLLAGPIASGDGSEDPTAAVGSDKRYRALLIIDSPTRAQVVARLADDPWTQAGILTTKSIERWEVLVGELGISDATQGE